MGVNIVPNKLPRVELSIAIAYNSKFFFNNNRRNYSFVRTSFPPIARTAQAAVDTGDGSVPNAFILKNYRK